MEAAARIGPNAITRVAEAMRDGFGDGPTIALFGLAGLGDYLEHPPEHMVDEQEVARLHRQLRASLEPDQAARISRDAGLRTGDYLLARRIPMPVQHLLQRLPPALACRVLLTAIRRHAWTFAGSGHFRATVTGFTKVTVRLEIEGNPLCNGLHTATPACDYYAATFERLFRILVHPCAAVTEVACEAMGAPACVFEIRW